jgi:glucokinase
MNNTKIVCAIDAGGTKIAGAAITENGDILRKIRFPNEGRTACFILDTCEKIVGELRGEFEISAVGIGTGGHIEPSEGRVLFAADIFEDYIGIPFKTELRRRFGIPAVADNDARAAVYGEIWKGSAADYRDVFGIILGTGVGGGYVHEGMAVYGAGYGAGEVGHLIIHPSGYPCGCGQQGCAERYLSGVALVEIYNRKSRGVKLSSGYDFFKLYDERDNLAEEILSDFTRDLAILSVSLSNLLAPSVILFGGGLMDTSDRWWDDFLSNVKRFGNRSVEETVLIRAKTGNDAALLGIARLAFKEIGVIP